MFIERAKRDLGWDNLWRHFGNQSQSCQETLSEKASFAIPKVASRGNPTHSPLFLGPEPGRGKFFEL